MGKYVTTPSLKTYNNLLLLLLLLFSYLLAIRKVEKPVLTEPLSLSIHSRFCLLSFLSPFRDRWHRGSEPMPPFATTSGPYTESALPFLNLLDVINSGIEITSWKARAYGIFTRVGEVSEIERVSAANE